MKKIKDLFEVKSGTNLELNRLKVDHKGINFVSRTAKNNGVSAKVAIVQDTPLIPAGVLTVAAGGSVLETFLQSEPFYSGWHIYYLVPKIPMSDAQKLYYCACIRANKYKYSYGRQANRTLGDIIVPEIEEIPSWVELADVDVFAGASNPVDTDQNLTLDVNTWKEFRYDDIFDIERGESHYLKDLSSGQFPYVSASANNNGVTAYVSIQNQKGGAISLAYDGSIGEAFYQADPFLASEKIAVLRINSKWKKELNPFIALFLITLIRKEKFRYNYGLKWSVNTRLLNSIIKVPVTSEGVPDWIYMETFTKNLAYSSSVVTEVKNSDSV